MWNNKKLGEFGLVGLSTGVILREQAVGEEFGI